MMPLAVMAAVENFLNILGFRIRLPVYIQDVDKRRLGSFDLRTEDCFLSYIHGDKQIWIRQDLRYDIQSPQ
jgi:hypothetical protein